MLHGAHVYRLLDGATIAKTINPSYFSTGEITTACGATSMNNSPNSTTATPPDRTPMTNALDFLNGLTDQQIPGGCDHCDAFQTVEQHCHWTTCPDGGECW